MRIFGIILVVLGILAGGTGGVFAYMSMASEQRVEDAKARMEELFPDVKPDMYDTAEELIVTMDVLDQLALEAYGTPDQAKFEEAKELVMTIFLEEPDADNFAFLRNIAGGAGGGIFLVGLLLIILGGKKKKPSDPAPVA